MWLCRLVLLAVLGISRSEVNLSGSYKFLQSVQFSDNGLRVSSYQIRAAAVIERVHHDLLSVKLIDPRLFIHTKKLPSESYKQTRSVFDSSENNIFFIELSEGTIKQIYLSSTEDPTIVNIKKSFSSLLQFQTKAGKKVETDISGTCQATYSSEKSSVRKTKSECVSSSQILKTDVWGGLVIPTRTSEINLHGNNVESISYKENYTIKMSIADFIETNVSTETSLLLENKGEGTKGLNSKSIESFISETEEQLGKAYVATSLSLDSSIVSRSEDAPAELSAVLKENFKFLADKKLGSKKSAIASLKVMRSLKQKFTDDIYSFLNLNSNKKIVKQLLDLLGAIQTIEGHQAAMKYLKMDSKDYNLDLSERYLWALSTSVNCKKAIILDLLSFAKKGINDDKLLETLVQTVSSMTRKYFNETKDEEFFDGVVKFLSENLDKCNKSDDVCQRIYLKAFNNIRSPKVTSLLMQYILSSSKRVGFQAMKALAAIGRDHWTEDVIKLAERVYLSNGTYDSSSKVLALNILLNSREPKYYKLIQLFKQNYSSPELKEYLLQRLSQVSEKDKDVEKKVKSALLTEGLYHYNTYAQGGLSTVFDRSFMKNGYLSTAQEVKSGLLKQGYVDIVLEESNTPKTVFSLGLFSNGLSSFVSSDGSEDDEDEEVNAGLELSVLGVEFRPFIFFQGHGELMGHVFSGTGSTLTPAYQANILLKDEVAYIPLGTGEFLSIGFSTIASVDLSGKIEISLWSRAAESLVQNSAGFFTEETVKIISPYINSQTKIELSAEPKLKLSSDIQFSGEVALCLKLEQPEIIVEYNTTSVANIIGGGFKSRKFVSRKIAVPGKTYALNSKNNEMCNVMYS